MREHAMKFPVDGDGKNTFGEKIIGGIHKQSRQDLFGAGENNMTFRRQGRKKPSVVTIAVESTPDDRGNREVQKKLCGKVAQQNNVEVLVAPEHKYEGIGIACF